MLLNIKSKMLLPKEETQDGEVEDPRAELVERLLEYKMYKYISSELKDKQFDAAKIMYKDPTIPDEISEFEEPVDLKELLSDLTLAKLKDIFNQVIKKQEYKIDPIRSKFGEIEKEEVSNITLEVRISNEIARNLYKKFGFREVALRKFYYGDEDGILMEKQVM